MGHREPVVRSSAARWTFIFAIAAVGLAFPLARDRAQASPPGSCPAVITSCGCTIEKAGTYTVANELTASQTASPNCIEIAASHSILNLKGNAVIGNGDGTGIGILIHNGADHVVVEGGDEGNATPPDDGGTNGQDFPAAQAVVTQWNIGIEDDGDYAAIELFKDIGGNIFQQNQGNATAGIVLNSAQHSIVGALHASYNGQTGIKLSHSSGVRLFNFSAIGNHHAGVWLDSSDDNLIATGSVAGNGQYGMWLLQSSRNLVIDCNGTSGNGDTGILLGCGASKCTGHTRSDNNRITVSGAPGNTSAGIVIEKKNGGNIITVTHNDGNPQDHDMIDLNPHCGSNTWYNNTGTSNQACIK